MMDFIFCLDNQSLREIKRSIVITLGWTYIALWSLAQYAPDLECKDGLFNPEMETGSWRAESVGQTLFNLYNLCQFGAVDSGLCISTSARSSTGFLLLNFYVIEIMDFIFYLDDHSLQQIMRRIVIPLQWTYIVLWSLDQPPQELACKDGWFNPEMETGSSTAAVQSAGQSLFNLYKLCRFALYVGVPGLALNKPPYVWLTVNELLRFRSNESQELFYKAVGIQTAVFIPCGNGVVELGTTNLVQADEQNKLRISSLLASVTIMSPNISIPLPMATRGTSVLTSSRSLLLSRSIDSAESSYVQCPTMFRGDQINIPQDTHQHSMSASELATGFDPYLQMLQLRPSSGPLTGGLGAQLSVPGPPFFPRTSQAGSFPVAPSTRNIILSAFGIWRPPSKLVMPPMFEGQYKLKRCLAILRHIHAEKLGQVSLSTVSSSQVHHKISERKRREKLKDSFEALRSVIPRCAREDKASILGYTREYLTSLKSRVEELEERNKELESELKKLLRAQSQEGSATSTALQQSEQGAATSTALQQPDFTCSEGSDSLVTVEVSKIGGGTISDEMGNIVVVVDRPTNTTDLMIAMVESLREMSVPLVSMATSTAHHEGDPSRLRYRMTATIKLEDHDMEQVKEGLVSRARKNWTWNR